MYYLHSDTIITLIYFFRASVPCEKICLSFEINTNVNIRTRGKLQWDKMDSEIIQETQLPNVPFTQDAVKKKSVNQYAWVILFHFDVNNCNPFSIMRLRDFTNSNFPWRGIKGEMTREFRILLHEFSCIPNKQFFIFAKIQYGKKSNKNINKKNNFNNVKMTVKKRQLLLGYGAKMATVVTEREKSITFEKGKNGGRNYAA